MSAQIGFAHRNPLSSVVAEERTGAPAAQEGGQRVLCLEASAENLATMQSLFRLLSTESPSAPTSQVANAHQQLHRLGHQLALPDPNTITVGDLQHQLLLADEDAGLHHQDHHRDVVGGSLALMALQRPLAERVTAATVIGEASRVKATERDSLEGDNAGLVVLPVGLPIAALLQEASDDSTTAKASSSQQQLFTLLPPAPGATTDAMKELVLFYNHKEPRFGMCLADLCACACCVACTAVCCACCCCN